MKIPFWHQTSEASCGPSCLLMLLNYYKPSYKLTRENEWDIWKDTTLLAWRGSHAYGIAFAALKQGLKVHLIREKRTFWKDVKFPRNNEPLRYAIMEQGKKAKKIGLKESIKKKIDMNFLEGLLKKNKTMIVLIKSIRKDGSLGFFHWVIPLEIQKDYVIINDPEIAGNRKVSKKLFIESFNQATDKKWRTCKEILIVEK